MRFMHSAFLILIPQKVSCRNNIKEIFQLSSKLSGCANILHCGNLLALMYLASLCNMPYICTVVSLIFC